MADVQPDKFVKINTQLFEAIYRRGFTQREIVVLCCIIRWTYGFNRKSAEMSVRFIARDTGLVFSHVSETLAQLQANNVVTIAKGSGRKPQVIALQKDFDKWSSVPKLGTVPKTGTVPESGTDSSQNGNANSSQIGNKDITSIYYKDYNTNLFSSNQDLTDDAPDVLPGLELEPEPMPEPKPDYEAEFEEIWKLYPNKQGKKVARDKYIKARSRKKNPATFDDIKHGVIAYAKDIKDRGTAIKYVKHGDAWMNQECWNDYMGQEVLDVSSVNDEGANQWQ